MKKWYAIVFLAFVVGGVAGMYAGNYVTVKAFHLDSSDNLAGDFASWAIPLGLMDKSPSDNLQAWNQVWWFADIDRDIAGMAFDRLSGQYRKELFRAVDRLDHAAPFLVKAGIAIGIKSQEVSRCILSGRSDPEADVETCVRNIKALYQDAPGQPQPSEQAVGDLGNYWNTQHRNKADKQPEKQAAALANARNNMIAVALAWSELRPYYRQHLVQVASYLERQSRQPDDYDGKFQDDAAFAAARQCILAAQLDMDSNVASCVKHADTSEPTKQGKSSSDKN